MEEVKNNNKISRAMTLDNIFKIISKLSDDDTALDVIIESRKSNIVKLDVIEGKLKLKKKS